MAERALINHLIIGAADVSESADFYCIILGYSRAGTFVDTGTGGEGIVLVREGSPQLLIVKFLAARLPSPQHIAFEVSPVLFRQIYDSCHASGLKTRSAPPLDWGHEGIGTLHSEGRDYENFYICDPTKLNLEIMALKARAKAPTRDSTGQTRG